MGSPGIVDAGKIPGKRSNFSQACSLLSQYLKENGSFGELAHGLSRNVESKVSETKAPIKTMDLLPMIEKSGRDEVSGKFPRSAGVGGETVAKSGVSPAKTEVEGSQLTIFYAGQVIVFNDFPVEKAGEIMSLASKSSSAAPGQLFPTHSPPMTKQVTAESVASFPRFPFPPLQERDLGSDLPIARKNSLARFLEKRKDRITAAEPYPARRPASPSSNRARV